MIRHSSSSPSANTKVSGSRSPERKMAGPDRIAAPSNSFSTRHQEEDRATAGSSNKESVQASQSVARRLGSAFFMPLHPSKLRF